MKWRKGAYFFSGTCIVIAIFSYFIFGVHLSIDFRGGMEITLRPTSNVSEQPIREALSNLGYKDAEVKTITDIEGNMDILVRIKSTDVGTITEVANKIERAVAEKLKPVHVELRQTQSVGPKIGRELMFAAFYAIIVTALLIMIYLWWRFEWIFGVGATIALIHDVFITSGYMNIMGIEYSMQTVAALLTILGYSINDTIVVYDRIRENFMKRHGEPIVDIINRSINETLSRTTITAGTVLLSLLVLFFTGGPVVHDFVVVMIFGVTFGTYSSIFVASSLIVDSGVKNIGKKMEKKGAKKRIAA
ncbi:MAG: protein translocase subunit SecF [bacterium]|nr:protein translocase subunit SecF [bacterium]